MSKRKILTYASLPYSGFDLLNRCLLQAAKDRRNCAETNLRVAKLATKQKTFDLYRPAMGLARVTENSNSLQKLLNFIYQLMHLYTGCNRRNGPNFGRVFLRSNYTDITQNTYIQSSMVTEILAREV